MKNVVTLRDIIGKDGVFIDGDWVESKDQDPDGEIRLIQLADIGDGVFINKSRRFMNRETATKLNCTFLKAGDILIARMPDPLGRACVFPGLEHPCVTVVDVCIVRPDTKRVDNIWLKMLINSYDFRNTINQFITGTTRLRISRGNLAKLTFELPSLTEQQRIADLLSKAEALIAKRKESIALLDEYLKSTFLEMFGDPVRNERGWEKVQLKHLAKVRIGPFGSLLHREDYVREGVPLVNPSHIKGGKIVIDEDLTISKNKMLELSAYIMKKDDVVLARRGEMGRCAIVTEKEDGYLCGTGSIFIRPSDKLRTTYLYKSLSSKSMTEVLENSAKGVTMKNLNSGIVDELYIPQPPLEVQLNFEAIIGKTESLKLLCRKSLSELENLSRMLSQQAFS